MSQTGQPTAPRLEWAGKERWPCLPGERHTFDAGERVCLCGALFMPTKQQTPWVTVFTPAVDAKHPKDCSYWFASDGKTGQPICDCGLAEDRVATPPPVPTAPAALWRLQGEYVVDRDGLVWRVVRDGGMATRADFTGIESIGIETLRSTKGPLTSLNDFVDAAAGAVPAAPGLDVERLAAALDVLSEDGLEYDLMAPEEREDRDDAAERLAAEYARRSPVQEEA